MNEADLNRANVQRHSEARRLRREAVDQEQREYERREALLARFRAVVDKACAETDDPSEAMDDLEAFVAKLEAGE